MKTQKITINRVNVEKASLHLVGDSPLISHAWSQKAKDMMIAKQTKKTTTSGREAKDPHEDFLSSLYRIDDGKYGFPSVAFKACAVRCAKSVEGLTMTDVRTGFHIPGELVEIIGDPTPREDMVRIGQGTADIRYRGEFKKWEAHVPIDLNAGVLTLEIIANLFSIGGFGTGIGEWRPERGGQFGRFSVVDVSSRDD